MSVPGLALGAWDSKYQTLVALDVELLRLLVLGTKNPKVVTGSVTIRSGETEGESTIWSSEDQLVIKRIEFTVPSGITVTEVTLDIDGTTVTVPYASTITPEELFGNTIYGNIIKIKLKVETAPTSDQTIDVKIYGYNAGKVQIPSG